MASNCLGAIPPSGEQLERNEPSVTTIPCTGNKVNAIRSAELASRHSHGEAHNTIALPAQGEWSAAGGGPQMIGEGRPGSSSDVNQGTTTGDERASRGQSVRRSAEASNDRGAKGRRKAVLGAGWRPSRKGRHRAARLSVLARWQTAWLKPACQQWAAHDWVSRSAKTVRLACSLQKSGNHRLSQPNDDCRPESRMRENRPSGLGGRRSASRSSYPHYRASLRDNAWPIRSLVKLRCAPAPWV